MRILEVKDAGEKGLGVFTTQPVARGTLVVAMEGVLLCGDDVTSDMAALQVGEDTWLCSDGSGIDDIVNHSCDPNTAFTRGDPVLYALRDIDAGDEITFDYSTAMSETGWSLDCKCGSLQCRTIVKPYGDLRVVERCMLQGMTLSYLRDSVINEVVPS